MPRGELLLVLPPLPGQARRQLARLVAFAALAAALPVQASATELQIEGYYRARARAFDTLSLDRELTSSEGFSSYIQHRLILRPRMLVTSDLGVFVDIRALDNVVWGNQPITYVDPVTGDDIPTDFMDSLQAPLVTEETADLPPADITIWRAWGEYGTPIGTFKFGRMPLHWGSGIWQNDGLGLTAEYGDTADRFQWELLFSDVYFRLAGLNAQLRRTPSRGFNLFTIDGAADTTLGVLDIEAEFVGQFGAGDLANGANDISISAFGGILKAELGLKPVFFGVEAGYASGDADPNDQRIKTFGFDRDYNVGLMLFEQPMPALAASVGNSGNLGRDYDAALTGYEVSNALYLKPKVGYAIADGLTADATVLLARVARVPEESTNGRGYGQEINATLRYSPVRLVDVSATFGVFLPGKLYADYSDDTYDGFGSPAFGGQLQGVISF
jgi:hypothetical protein